MINRKNFSNCDKLRHENKFPVLTDFLHSLVWRQYSKKSEGINFLVNSAIFLRFVKTMIAE